MTDAPIAIKSSSVEIEKLNKKFTTENKEFTAVDNLNLTINSGELVTLLGPSGCGKTTTLRMIAGFEYPTSGKILIGSEDISNTAPNKRGIGMVFQSYALFPHLTIYENVAYGLNIKKMTKAEIKKKTDTVLEIMHLEQFKNRQPSQLSGGQQQRVALARSIVTEPKVLLFDEPLSNLDAKLREYMRDELRKIQQRLGITSLYVTHDQTEAMAISDKVVIMDRGKLQQQDIPQNIYLKPKNHFVADFMGKADFITGTVDTKDDNKIVLTLLGRKIIVDNTVNFNVSSGLAVDCVIRPEYWEIDGEGKFDAFVRKATYYGTSVEYELEINEVIFKFIDYNHLKHGIKNEGEKIKLSLNERHVNLLEKDSERE